MEYENFIICDIDEFKKKLCKINFSIVKKNKKNLFYINISSSFDIETTSLYFNEVENKYISNSDFQKLKAKEQKKYKKIAFMYIWQFCVDKYIVIGRSWKQFIDLIDYISDFYNCNYSKRHFVIYVHNLSYEFQFMQKLFNFVDIFALKERKPIKAITEMGIEFRCSYLLSGYSLAKLSDNLTEHKIKKLVGDLDYNLIRHNKTILTPKELEYCYNDVIIVKYFIDECIKRFGNIIKIPLTQTGIVRNYTREKCLNTSGYYYLIKQMTIEENEFKSLKRAFNGGFTHGNVKYIGQKIKDVHSIDFTSSYPFVLCSEKYPMSKGKFLNIKISEKGFNNILKNYLAIFDVTFYKINSKYNINIIPLHKCYRKEKYESDNGKLVKADKIFITVTNIDFFDIKDFYDYDYCEISNIYLYEKNYLPRVFIENIFKFYGDKTQLKGVQGKEIEYLHSKEMLNSLYGMCVTDIVRDTITFKNGEWGTIESNFNEEIEKYNTDKRRFLNYAWGVFCTSYARHNLYTGILEFKKDYIYCDTDSIKCINYDKHIDYINNYNNECVNKLNKMCDYHNFNYDLYKPKTIKGKEKILGIWDYEGEYKYFKSLGAKRYLYLDSENHYNLVVSGLGKQAIKNICEKFNNDDKKIFDFFTIGMYIDRNNTGKMTHTYIDEEINGIIKDYNNIMGEYHEKSYIHLENTDYCLTLQNDFIDLIISIGKRDIFNMGVKQI